MLRLFESHVPVPSVYPDLYWLVANTAFTYNYEKVSRTAEDIEHANCIIQSILNVIYDKKQRKSVSLHSLYVILPNFIDHIKLDSLILRRVLDTLSDKAGELLQYYHEPLYQLYRYRCGWQFGDEDGRIPPWTSERVQFFTMFSTHLLRGSKLGKLSPSDRRNVLRTIVENKLNPFFAFHNVTDSSFTFAKLTNLMLKYNHEFYDSWLDLLLEYKNYEPFLFDLLVTKSNHQTSLIVFCDLFNELKLDFRNNFPLFYELLSNLLFAFVQPLKNDMNGEANVYTLKELSLTVEEANNLFSEKHYSDARQK